MIRARFGRRAAAAAVDAALGCAVCVLFAKSAGVFFARQAFVTLRIGQPDTWWTGPVPLVLGMFGEVVYFLPVALFLAWLLDPATGATIGKRLFAIQVRAADGAHASVARRFARTIVQTVGLWGWAIALALGSWQLAVLAGASQLAILAGTLLALGRTRLMLHDRISGTSVYAVAPVVGGENS
jgi:uncharacterized RDD family membrane protein YckC